jgi:arylsulfatase
MAGSAGKRYDLFMNNLTERTWMAVPMGVELKKLMGTFVKYPPRKLQSLGYTGPITISEYQRLEWLRDQMKKEGVNLSLPTGN